MKKKLTSPLSRSSEWVDALPAGKYTLKRLETLTKRSQSNICNTLRRRKIKKCYEIRNSRPIVFYIFENNTLDIK